MNSVFWTPLLSVLVGGILTIVSSLTVEIFRDRTRERHDARSRRRSGLEEMERAAIDAHAKITTSTQIIRMLYDTKSEAGDEAGALVKRSRAESNQLILTAVANSSGKVEVLRTVGLAARVGTPEIRRLVSDYATVQMRWSQSPTSSGEVVEALDRDMRQILEHIATELRQLDQEVDRRGGA
jgi:hypothetical protein